MKARFLKFQYFNLDLAMSGSTEETVQVAGPLVPRRDTFRMYGSSRGLLHPNTWRIFRYSIFLDTAGRR